MLVKFLKCWWQNHCVDYFLNVESPTSQSCHWKLVSNIIRLQHLSPTATKPYSSNDIISFAKYCCIKVIPNDAKYKINKGVVYDSRGTRNSYSKTVTEFQQFVKTISFFVDWSVHKMETGKTYMQKTEAISLRSGIKRTLVGIFLWPCIHISEKDLSSML